MIESIKENFERNRITRVQFLNIFKKLLIFLSVSYTITWAVLGYTNATRFSVLFLLVVIATFLFNKPKHQFLNSVCLSTTFVLIIMIIVSVTGGLTSPFIIWFIVPVYVATSLLGIYGTVGSAIATIFFFLLITYVEFNLEAINEIEVKYYSLLFTISFLSAVLLIAFFASRNNIQIEREVSNQKEMRFKAETINKELVAKRKEQDTLLSIVSHELRTPAATLSMLLDPEDINTMNLDQPLITKTMNHLMDVLNDMRMVKEPEIILEIPKRKVYVDQSIEDAIQLVSSYVETKNIIVNFNNPSTERVLCLVRDKLIKQIAMNLIKNCVNHSEASVLDISIKKDITGNEGLFTITFSDNGKGIPEYRKKSLFQPFKKDRNESSGSGLGLHLSKKFAKEGLNGDLNYIETTKPGATFQLSFKAEIVEEEPIESVKLKEENISVKPSLKGIQILFAEDNLVISMLTKKILETNGAIVHSAKDGEVALELFKKHPIDLVLTDIFMPNLDGYGLTKSLRDLGFKGQIIGCSAASIGDEVDELLNCGADKVFIKPLPEDEFLHYVNEKVLKHQ